MTRKLTALALAAIVALAAPLQAASLSSYTGASGTNPTPGSPTLTPALNGVISAINSGITAQSMAGASNYRNFLDNGGMTIAQRGTGVQTGGTTSGCTLTTYVADRWCVDTNVGSGAGRGQVVTSSPTPPPGFQNAVKVYRNSGALLQPVCYIQEIPTSEAVQLQGQTVQLSAYLQPLAGLTSASGAVQAYIITGTGTDEGLGTVTASPAITPAWTGIAGGTTAAATWTLGTSAVWARYSLATPVLIPVAATEVGVEICFTPVGSASGTTDGFAITGVQLEVLGAGATAASPFEFRPKGVELAKAQQYYFRFAEVSGAPLNGYCQATGANTTSCTLGLPQPMFKAVPTITITTAGTFKVNIAGSLTTIATPTAGTCAPTACIVTAANTNTAGQVLQLTGAAGATGVWEVSADF